MSDSDRLPANLRALGVAVERLPEIPQELADYIAKLTPEDIDRIRGDIRELEQVRLLPEAR
jgi:hypothetical protein